MVGNQRSEFIRARVTAQEQRNIYRAASILGYSPSDYIRKTVLLKTKETLETFTNAPQKRTDTGAVEQDAG